MKKSILPLIIASLVMGVAACEKQGPVERAGEEVDEAVNTMKNDGKETTGDKVDDAVDELRKGANEAKEEVKN